MVRHDDERRTCEGDIPKYHQARDCKKDMDLDMTHFPDRHNKCHTADNGT